MILNDFECNKMRNKFLLQRLLASVGMKFIVLLDTQYFGYLESSPFSSEHSETGGAGCSFHPLQ